MQLVNSMAHELVLENTLNLRGVFGAQMVPPLDLGVHLVVSNGHSLMDDCVVLNNLLVFLPVVVGVAVHERVRRPADVFFLSQLELGLFLWASLQSLQRAQNNCFYGVTTSIIELFELTISVKTISGDQFN